MKLAQILDAFGAVDDEHRNEGYRAVCPCHDDAGSDKPSLIIDVNEETRNVIIMCEGQRPECEAKFLVAAVGLTLADLSNVTYIGQSARHTRTAARKPTAPADARQSADGEAFAQALYLSMELAERPDGDVARRLRDEFGLNPAELDENRAYSLGVGIDRDPTVDGQQPEEAWLTMTARTPGGDVAYSQRRNPDPKAKTRWLSARNPGKGTAAETRWDGCGIVGARHPEAPVIITEGPSDGLTVAALDVYDVVSFRGAWAAAEIMDVRDALVGREVVVFPDKDGAGEGAATRIIDRVAPIAASLRIASVPDYAEKDVRDVFKHDPATFADRFAALVADAVVYEVAEVGEFDPDPYLKGTDHDRAQATIAWIRATGKDVAHTDGHGWLYFDGTVWVPDSDTTILHAQTQLGLKVRAIAADEFAEIVDRARASGEEVKETPHIKALNGLARQLLTSNRRAAAMSVMQTDPAVRRRTTEFDSAKDVLAVGNGVVNLRTGELRPMTSKDLLTRRLTLDYDPNAEAPQWEAFLSNVLVKSDGVTPDPDLVAYLQEVVGYGITGEANRPAHYYVLCGRGGNGKSVFTSVLGSVFNAYSKATAFATFAGNDGEASAGVLAARAGLAGARLVFTSESGRGERFGQAFLKSFTGGDPVEAKVMRGNPWTYTPQGLVFTATNHKPLVDSIDRGIWRRLRLVMWYRKIADEDMDLGLQDRLLTEEAQGILTWAIRGAQRYYSHGSQALTQEPETVRAVTAAYRESADVLRDFLESNVLQTSNEDDRVTAPAFWQRYREWCELIGDRKMGRTAFYAALDERLGERHARGGTWPHHWRGVQLIDPHRVREEVDALAQASILDVGPMADRMPIAEKQSGGLFAA